MIRAYYIILLGVNAREERGQFMPATKAKNKPQERVVITVLLGAAICLGMFFFIRAVLTLLEPSRAYKAPLTSSPLARTPSTAVSMIATDFSFDAFHRKTDNAVAVGEPIIGEDAPETDLNLDLTGQRVSGDGSSTATLKLPDGAEQVFKLGETILRNVTLEAVYATHIIISRGGTHERVTFERGRGELFQIGTPDEAVSLEAAPEPKSSQASVAPKASTEALKQALSEKTPSQLLKDLRFAPVREGGTIKGYRLQTRDKSIDLTTAGFQRGDVVTHISGTDIRQGRPNFEAIFKQNELNSNSTTVTVDRDGSILTLSLN